MHKIVRITTVPMSLKYLLKGQMAFMKSKGFEVIAISSNGNEVQEVIDVEGCSHFIVPFTRTISPVQDLKCLWQLVLLLRKIKPQIVHTHTPKAGLIGMMAAFICRIPIRLHTIAGIPWLIESGVKKKLLKNIERITIFFSLKTYVNAKSLLKILNEEKVLSSKLSVLGNGTSNGIDTKFFSVNDEIEAKVNLLKVENKIDANDNIWIFVGRLVKDKGIEELIEAFCKLHSLYPNNKLWLIGGEEPELDPLSETCRTIIHSSPFIKCFGFQKDVRPYLAAANTLVFPSYREGFPNVPMQAALLDCNLILSNINGCNEIVTHQETGLLVEVKNSKDLFEKMLFAYKHPEVMQGFSKKVKQEIIDKYEQMNVWNNLYAEYQELLKSI